MSEVRYALQIVHGYNEPFFSLSNCYTGALQQQGYQVTTVFLTGAHNHTIIEQSLAEETLLLSIPNRLLKGLKFRSICRVKAILDQKPYQLIIGQRYKAVYIAAILALFKRRLKILGVAHGYGFLTGRGRQFLLSLLGNRLQILGVSGALVEDMRHNDKMGLAISILHNCIDTDLLIAQLIDRQAARGHLSIEDKSFVFGNVGRLHPDKDQSTLIRAFASFVPHAQNARLILIGAGKLENEYKQLIKELEMDKYIQLTGQLDKAYRYFKAFDAYVSTSVKESFGIVLVEAMLAKIPVISTDCGGAREVLTGDADFFNIGDDVKLSQLLLQMMNRSQADRINIGNNNYQSVQTKFSQAVFNQHMGGILENK